MVAREPKPEDKSGQNKQGTGESEPGPDDGSAANGESPGARPKEIGGRKGLDPTRYGDWEKGGRCIDF